jgi:hypothetical protein
MIDLMPAPAPVAAHTKPVDHEGTTMLLHYEALARSRQQEAEQAAREYALARSFTAGRRWAVLARFAARRAERARAATRTRGTVGGLRSAV